jgi:hypothetical protein
MVRTATAGTIAPNYGWSGGSVAGLARSLGAIGLLPVSERWRSSFFASHLHVTTISFCENWYQSERCHGSSGSLGSDGLAYVHQTFRCKRLMFFLIFV